MTISTKPPASILRSRLRTLVVAFFFLFAAAPTQSAYAQTFAVLHNFTGGGDGANPSAGLTMDRAGNLYGTTYGGGATDFGVVYELAFKNRSWLLTPLFGNFNYTDGAFPEGPVTIGPNGTLYGTTNEGGTGENRPGTLFNLAPPPHAQRNVLTPWTLTVLHDFAGGSDGEEPGNSVLLFDAAGNLYGTTPFGGGTGCTGDGPGCGTVFELAPALRGPWIETILDNFNGGQNGSNPTGGVIFDSEGNLYGATSVDGAYNCGTAFKLAPTGSGWVKTTLYVFNPSIGDGCNPEAGVTFDASGNLYGTTANGGGQNAGTVFKLSPGLSGGWTETVLYWFSNVGGYGGPSSKVFRDAAGNLYGTTVGVGSYGFGSVFKLTPSNGGWVHTTLHDFSGQDDGKYPEGDVLLDANGNLYGTCEGGGLLGYGVVWEVTP